MPVWSQERLGLGVAGERYKPVQSVDGSLVITHAASKEWVEQLKCGLGLDGARVSVGWDSWCHAASSPQSSWLLVV